MAGTPSLSLAVVAADWPRAAGAVGDPRDPESARRWERREGVPYRGEGGEQFQGSAGVMVLQQLLQTCCQGSRPAAPAPPPSSSRS